MASKSEKYIREDRDFAKRKGEELSRSAGQRASSDRDRYERVTGTADEMYDPLIAGQGGYTAADRTAILNEPGLQDAVTTDTGPTGLDQNLMSPEEKAAWLGDTNAYMRSFDPGKMQTDQNYSQQYQRGAVNDMDARLQESLTPELGASSGYFANMGDSVSSTRRTLADSGDPTRLRVSDETLDSIRMSPEEQAAIISDASNRAGKAYRAQLEKVNRSGRAAGLSAAGMGIQNMRYMREGSGEAADAAIAARVAASNAGADRAASAEYIRQGGEGAAANLGTQQAFGLGEMKMRGSQALEDTRLGTERDIANRKFGIAETAGKTRLGSEEDINAQQRNVSQFNTSVGTDIAMAQERDAAARAQSQITNRQQNQRGNQQQRFGEHVSVNDLQSGRAKTVADATRADAAEGRGYLRDQQNISTGREQGEYDRQTGLYNSQGAQMQGSTAMQYQRDSQPKWWEKAIGAVTSGAGALLGTGGIGSILPKKKP